MKITKKRIKDHTIEGQFKDDADILKIKDQYFNILEEQMRSVGQVPVLNLGPLWYTSWDSTKEVYNFEMTLYGVYVGKRKAMEIIGWDSLLDKWYSTE